ncbi:M15 family metallopeptidase, partial [Arthrobacter sp. JCM 19049]|uniref:M15 family metallopeptidase n=1 Tax=Arthrobacter sp. JCM 19049 TaxID=1460643 RepID=UPI002436FEE3
SQGITTAAVPSTDVASFVPTARKLQRGAGRIDVFVSKSYPLSPARYVPKTKTVKGTSIRLRPEAADAYLKMKTAAKKSGVNIALVSGYRSYDRQAQLFRQYTQQYGSKYAQRISAKPGTSEHQTGLAVDVGNTNHQCGLQACFESTKLGRWMAKNAHKYGFILRYPKGYESVTGYAYEPWHFRYVARPWPRATPSPGPRPWSTTTGWPRPSRRRRSPRPRLPRAPRAPRRRRT